VADTDRLSVLLHDLGGDVDTLPPRPASDVRARGDQRTRRKRVTAAGAAALTVAAVVAGTALTQGALPVRRAVVPPAISVTNAPTPTPAPAPPPLYATSGTVDPALFLPAGEWAGPDLADGHPTRWQRVSDDGTVKMHTCDVDTSATGDVGLAQVADAVTAAPLGTERIRTYATPDAARSAAAVLTEALNRCPAPDNSAYATAQEDPMTREPYAINPQHLFRLEVGSTQGGMAGIEWVAIFSAGGTSVGTLVVNEPPATTAGFATMRRLLNAALTQLAASPTNTLAHR